jgi:MFS family permease
MESQSWNAVPTRHGWALASVAAAQFLAAVDAFIVNVVLPSIRADLHADATEMQVVVAVYQIAAPLISGGRLGNTIGRKRVFIAVALGFTLTSLWCALCGLPAMLIFARAAQGGAAAMMVPQALASIHTLFPDGARTRAFTVFGTATGLGGAVGFMLGGWLVTLNLVSIGWHSIFCVNVSTGLGIAAAAGLSMPLNGDARLDPHRGGALFAALIGLLARARRAMAAVARDFGRSSAANLVAEPATHSDPEWWRAADRSRLARSSHLRSRHARDVPLLSWQPALATSC